MQAPGDDKKRKSFPTEQSIRKAREAFLIQKGRTIYPDGLNIREKLFNCFPLLRQFIISFHGMFIFNLHCQIVLRISGNMLHKTRPM